MDDAHPVNDHSAQEQLEAANCSRFDCTPWRPTASHAAFYSFAAARKMSYRAISELLDEPVPRNNA